MSRAYLDESTQYAKRLLRFKSEAHELEFMHFTVNLIQHESDISEFCFELKDSLVTIVYFPSVVDHREQKLLQVEEHLDDKSFEDL